MIVDTMKFEAGRLNEIASGGLQRTSLVTSDDESSTEIAAFTYVVTGTSIVSR